MKSSIGGDTIKLSISKIIVTTFSLIMVMVLSRITTLKEYGTYSQIILTVNLGIAFIMLGLPNSVNYFLARAENESDKHNFVSIYYTLTTVLTFVVGILLLILSPWIVKYFNNKGLFQYTYILLILPWAKFMNNSVDNILVVSKKTKLLLYYRVIHSALLVGAVYYVYFQGYGLNEYFKAFLFTEVVFALLVYVIVNNSITKISIKINRKLIKDIFKFSIPIGAASLIGTLNIQFDKLIVGKVLGTNELALYTNASKEMPVNMIAVSLTVVLLPRLVEYVKANKIIAANKLWKESVIMSYYIICFFSMVFFVFSSDMLVLLYSEQYVQGANVFRIYSLVLLLRTTYFGIMLNSIGKTKFILYSSILTMISNIILNYIFINLFGFEGPAIATLLSLTIMALMQLIATSHVIKVKFKDLFPWPTLARITIINILFGLFMYLSKVSISNTFNLNSVFESALISVIFGITYIIIFWRKMKQHWNILNSEEGG